MERSLALSLSNNDILQVFPQLRVSLQQVGLTTIKDIAKTSPQRISEATGLNITDSEDLCNTALSKLQNNGFKNFFIKATNISSDRRERISTGSKNVDNLLGGGIETGALTHFYGDPVSGKTQLCYTLCALLPLYYGLIYIDTENKFRPERVVSIAKSRGLNINDVLLRIQVAKPIDTNQQELRIEAACGAIEKSNSTIKLLVVDSMTYLYRVDYAGRSKLTEKQQKLNQYMHKLSKIAQTNSVAVVVTNQVQYTPDSLFGTGKPAPIGAQVMLYASTHTVFLSGSNPEVMLARLVHSPCYPQLEANYSINERGITDVDHNSCNS
jgi:DNA repair protein RadA